MKTVTVEAARHGGFLPEEMRHLSFASIARPRHPRALALVAAGSAAAMGTYAVLRYSAHHRIPRPHEQDDRFELQRLSDLRRDKPALELIQRELLAEWGPFAPADMGEMRRLIRNTGRLTYVIRFYEDGVLGPPAGVLQTARADVGGDPEKLVQLYPSFRAITRDFTRGGARRMKGDTALLLQITAFGARSRGVGSRLRDAALYALPASVRFALTTTPVEDANLIHAEDAGTYAAAMKFHARGGARPAGAAKGFKTPDPVRLAHGQGRQLNPDVVFMRYVRLESGDWEGVSRPPTRPQVVSGFMRPLRRVLSRRPDGAAAPLAA